MRSLVRALVTLLLAAALWVPGAAALADPGASGQGPVRMVLVASGLSWDDVSPAATPTIACLADRSGLAAMNVGSESAPPTPAQGLTTLETGMLAEHVDPGDVPRDRLSPLVAEGAVRITDVGGGTPAQIDARAADALAAVGGCEGAPRLILASVSPGAGASAALELLLDTRTDSPGDPDAASQTVLTSGSTHQAGVVLLTDVLPTILASHGRATTGLPGQVITSTASTGPLLAESPLTLVTDRTRANALVDAASVPALASWAVIPLLGLLVLLIPQLARRPPLAAWARRVTPLFLLAVPAGLLCSLVPWWRSAHPAWALTGTLWALALPMAAIALLGPWRRAQVAGRPAGTVGAVAVITVGVILLESALGSPLQLGAPLGAQAIRGGRFYGISNHLAGVVLAATLIALLVALVQLRRRSARTALIAVVGLVVIAVSALPTMGADVGSLLCELPALGVLILAVSGRRPRWWQVLALGGAALAAFLAVALLDHARPPAARSHLGRFIDQIADGQAWRTITGKLSQNIAQVTGYPVLAVLLLLAVLVTVAAIAPRALGARRLASLQETEPISRAVMLAGALGAWIGYATNDTGAVLAVGALAVMLTLITPMLPDPAASS